MSPYFVLDVAIEINMYIFNLSQFELILSPAIDWMFVSPQNSYAEAFILPYPQPCDCIWR